MYYLKKTPPNGIKINDSLFYDQSEVTNVDWREYMYWVGRVFGTNSEEFKSTTVDSTVWRKFNCLTEYEEYFHRHPVYNNHPVVGISQKQANSYSQWRSDRVYEMYLIEKDVIKINYEQNRACYFSIENYWAGKYMNIKPDSNYKYYPHYRLPSVSEYKESKKYLNSKFHDIHCEIQCGINPCLGDSLIVSNIIRKVYSCDFEKKFIYNLEGNVREWTNEKDVAVGGGWYDSKEAILSKDTFHLETQDAWTGFRNVCEWKEWK